MTSVFAEKKSDLFATYRVRLQWRDRVTGGVPKSPDVIEGWLRAKTGIQDNEEIRQMMLRTLIETGAEVTPDMSYEQLVEASQAVAALKQTTGFKRDETGIFIEDRQVKAMLKESVNILYAGERWGKTRKGPMNFTAERVFVQPPRIYLCRNGVPLREPDGVEMIVGHLTGPEGRRSTLTYYEFAEKAEAEFTVMTLKDEIDKENWPEIWLHAQENGLGSLRSQSFGRFDVTLWERTKE